RRRATGRCCRGRRAPWPWRRKPSGRRVGWSSWPAFWAAAGRPALERFGRSRPSSVVANLGRAPQLPHPRLDLLVQVGGGEALPERVGHALEGRWFDRRTVFLLVRRLQVFVGHAQLRPEAELDVLEDGGLATGQPLHVLDRDGRGDSRPGGQARVGGL